MLGASLSAMLAVLLTVSPVIAANAIQLEEPAATPTTGTTTTLVTFTVTYKNSWWLAPDYVRVSVAGMTKLLTHTSGSSWKHGALFSVSTVLPAGTWTPVFDTRDRQGHTASVEGPVITITPPPTPTHAQARHAEAHPQAHAQADPGPHAAADPAAHPSAAPRATPSPTPRPAPGPPLARRRARCTRAEADEGDPAGRHAEAQAHGPRPRRPGRRRPPPRRRARAPRPASRSCSRASAVRATAPRRRRRGGSGGNGGGPVADNGIPGAGHGGPSSPLLLLLAAMPAIILTTGGVTMTMALIVFGRRRRAGDPTASDEELAAAAASGVGFVPGGPPSRSLTRPEPPRPCPPSRPRRSPCRWAASTPTSRAGAGRR